ncbi:MULTISPECIES: P-loop NTPase fold protein [unclassified Pseudomonas]|uniref:P-loop NTPase fold protein n=1 Tax=unclassified Pseudomonas TaxID=196821 RepID=UPI000A1FB559|nr:MULTISPECIES: P-loop NTPase fold protein [unclassified Pseudomonas]
MRFSEYSKGLRGSEITPLLQFFLSGILAGEAWAIGRIIGVLLNKHLVSLQLDVWILALAAFGVASCLIFAVSRGALQASSKLIKSCRFDLLLVTLLGFYLSFSSDGFGNEFYAKYLEKLNFSQLACLSASPVIIAWVAMIRAFLQTFRKGEAHPYFISDREIEKSEEDLLDIKDRADIFAERVLNGGSSESLVFGIDAPWGAGKSSFVKLCCNYWKNKGGRIIVHHFEPLRYEDGTDLTEKFIDDLISTIQQHVFAPSLRPLFKRYENLVKDKKKTSLLDIKTTLSLNSDSIDSTLEEMKFVLKNINARIIVVVDDLDRMHWSSAKSILFSIKRSFQLPGINYVICYDTSKINVTPENADSEKTQEFLEKFVNIKTSIFLSAQDLADFVLRYFDSALSKPLNLSIDAADKLKLLSRELTHLFNDKDFHQYTPFIGDIRKIKRLINTLVLLDIDKIDFNENDFNKLDILHLTLIFIYSPATFRKIYESETSGKSGTFSWTAEGNKLKNSDFYETFKTQLVVTPTIHFLLSRIFDAPKMDADHFSESETRSRAVFQGKSRPLERHLHLIAKLSKPISWESHRFLLNKKDKLFKTTTIKPYLDQISVLPPLDKESGQHEFWRIVANHSGTLETEKAVTIIDYLIDTLPNHSLLGGDELNDFRSTAVRYIAKLLDENITSQEKNSASHLSPAESAIVKLVYGDAKGNAGIIERLASPERGVLGLHDLMTFRHYCTIKTKRNRLWQALMLHGNEKPLHSGHVEETKDQAREISQFIFNLFKQQYIESGKNILEEINTTDPLKLFGRYEEIFTLSKNTKTWEEKIKHKKQDIKDTLLSRLGNVIIDDCGVFDESGQMDKHGISKAFSEYLFSVCFDPKSSDGLLHFSEYLLNFANNTLKDVNNPKDESSLSALLNNLDRVQLGQYWKSNHEAIKARAVMEEGRVIYKTYSKPSFRTDLPLAFRALDSLFFPEKTTLTEPETP